MTDRPQLPPDLLRGLTSPRLSRRGFLRAGGLSALAAGLTACGVSKAGNSAATNSASVAKQAKSFWSQQHKTGQLVFANWPAYIDVGKNGSHPSIDLFTKETGISVKYLEKVQENAEFFGQVQPELAAGQGTGYDIIVVTNGTYLDKYIQLGYLVPLDQSMMKNFDAHASSLVKNPSYDPGNKYTMAWQSGMTGIGYDPKAVGHKITSWQDLQDPALKGKIGMFADTQDLPGCALLAVGVAPEHSTPADWKKAAAWLKKQQPLVYKYYDQDYLPALSKGEVIASMAWSGDIFQANLSGGHLEFAIPKEGGMVWTDNMCIPKHAAHPFDAMTYMDFVYQPKIAAMITEYVEYVSPVDGVQQVVRQDASKASGKDKQSLLQVANSPLAFPDKSEFSRLHRYRVLTPSEQKQWDATFEPIYQS